MQLDVVRVAHCARSLNLPRERIVNRGERKAQRRYAHKKASIRQKVFELLNLFFWSLLRRQNVFLCE